MALDTGVARSNIIHLRRIEDVAARGMHDMFATGAVAALAADVPFCNLLGVNVVVDGMTAITGSLHHIGRKSTPITALTR